MYIYYSPTDTSVNRLSRFTLVNDSIDMKSEKIILQLYSQREICCHTGGSIAFGKDRMLFLSTGDNTTPFDEPNQPYNTHGFAPLDDRPGFEHYDDRRSAGNTNDLRGKILRIKVNENGTYEIPDGNLFPKGTEKTRPEIYVMGDRNPYRISVDQKNGFLYWGEVGPDSNVDSLETRGPRGYDEVNQARKAGFFGWPLFIGDNYAYHAYDYATGKSGPAFDPQRPINDSRNNTGLRELPPANPAFIWYPYGISKDFPQVGSGGRTAMAGPVYYTDMYPKETRLPDYYNGKLFIYEWMRGWIKVVTMRENGDFDNMEPFMLHTKFSNPVDMEVGPDGKLYILEYGSGWFAKNPDAGLVRIDFNSGNRPPVVNNISVDKTSGDIPLQINATVDARDPDGDKLTYEWDLGNGTKKTTTEPKLQYTLNSIGDYPITVTVKDDKNASSKSGIVAVYAGNEAPQVNIELAGNKTFYFPGSPVKYNVVVNDKDDTSKIDIGNLIVTADYAEGTDKAGSSQGHQVISETMMGKNLMMSLDCKSCHKVDEKSIGPAFTQVAERYQKNPDALNYLVQKVIKGGSGNWGEVAMAAHPDLKPDDARMIINWVLSLASSQQKIKSLPQQGTVNATLNKPAKDNGVLTLLATYTDKGGNNIKPLDGGASISLRNSKLMFAGIENMEGFNKASFNGTAYMLLPANNGWFSTDSIDLSTISRASIMLGWTEQPIAAYTIELHLDSPEGKKIGEYKFEGVAGKQGEKPSNAVKPQFKTLNSNIEQVNDGKLHKLFVVAKVNDPKASNNTLAMAYIQFFQK